MRYNTGNPVEPNGSDDPRDLYDNTQVFDKFVTSPNFSEKDRLGTDRLTWAGAVNEWRQMLQGAGFETVHLAYVDGVSLTVSRPTQLVDRAGVTYSVKLPANFPLTLSGNWAADQALLTDRADNPLRQQLSSTADPVLGAAMLGRSSVTIASIKDIGAQVKDSTRILVLQSYHPGRTYGGGKLVWASSVPKSKHDGFLIFSPTVPAASVTTTQATIISYMNRTGETDASGSGCWLRLFSGEAHMEWGGVTPGTDCGLLAQKIVDFCVPNGISLRCDEVLTVGSTVKVPQYRTDPAVTRVFNHSCVSLRSVVSTLVSGPALRFESSGADLEVGELNGPGPDAGASRGVFITGQGAGRVKVNFTQGFQNGIHLEESYAHTVNVGWIDNCIRGIALVSANDNRITGGRVGGRYSTPQTVGILDPTTCEIGVSVGAGCASNRITLNIEYCRRSATSVGLRDSGVGTQFSGYIESCVAWNVYADGRNATINVLPGGSVRRADNCGFFAGDTNRIEFEAQQDYHNETPSPEKNTLTFESLQALATSGTGQISGKNGLATYARNLSPARNEVVNGNALGAGSWSSVGIGGASAAGIFTNSNVGMPELGLFGSTQVTLPALAADGAEYVISQGSINMAVGPFSFGLFAFCAAGDVDIYIRVISSDAAVQHRMVTRLASVSGGGFKRIATELNNSKADPLATYQVRLRSAVGCTLYLCGAFAINRTDIEVPAVNTGATKRSVISGSEVAGRMFPNGLVINGALQKDYRITSGAEAFDTVDLMFSTLILSGSGYNITLPAGSDGQEITIKKDGASGTVGILLSGTTIDGSSGGVTMNTLDVLRLRFVPTFGWLKV